jgi:DNA 3'-phosphatase
VFRFVEKSGVVSVREKIHPMFKPKALKPLENDLNYIIIENRKITSSDLCRQLNCPDIPQEILVLHREWLEQCLNRKSLVDVSDYIVDVSAVPEDVAESSVEGLSSKRKRSDDDNETSRTSQCESVESRPKQQLKVMEFQYSKATIPSEEEFNTILSDSGKPSLLYKLCPVPRANFNRVIAFDMDGTLITTKSGATFSKSIDDWKFLYPNVPAVLRQEYESGAHLAIISNQNGVSQGHTTVTELTKKLRAIVDAIGVPMDVLCAFENDIYRKPRIGSFDFLLNQRVSETQEGVSSGSVASRDPDLLARCIYVGDAAGRPKQGTRKKDFSASDYKMALNANIGVSGPVNTSHHRCHSL